MTTGIKFEKRAVDYREPWAQGVGVYYRSSAPKWQLRTHLESLSLTRFKAAAIGGEQESGFEQAFASLAYAYIKDKSPRLLDFMVGFQLVERNQDNTKAMGVFGFRVGDSWLYAPVFFLNGDLKGHELLYLKKSNTFVPMKENWVNYIISQKPHQLGEPSDESPQQLGAQMPNLRRLTSPPGYGKIGSDSSAPVPPPVQAWARAFLPVLAAGATVAPFGGDNYSRYFDKHAGLGARLDLGRFLAEDIELLKAAHDLYASYPLIRRGFDSFYGTDFFVKTARRLHAAASSLLGKRADEHVSTHARMVAFDDVINGRDRRRAPVGKKKARAGSLLKDAPPPEHPLKSGALRVFVYDRVTITDNLKELDDEERERLMRDTVLIKDKRDPHAQSMAYNVQTRAELVNPSDCGLYDVLEKPGKFSEMLVITHPHTHRGRELFSTVVRKSDARAWMNTHQTNLWVRPTEKPDRSDFADWFKTLPAADDLSVGALYLLVGPGGQGTAPFVVRESLGDGTYRVEFRDYPSFGQHRPRHLPRVSDRRFAFGVYDREYNSDSDVLLRINRRAGASLRSTGSELTVPVNFKALKLSGADEPAGDSLLHCCDQSGSSEEPVSPGNLADVQMLLYEKTAALQLFHPRGGSEVMLKSAGETLRMPAKAALIRLVCGHGLSEPAAREMLKEAERSGNASYRLKYAYGFGPGAPAFPEPQYGTEPVGYGSVNAIYPQEESLPVSDLDSGRTDPRVYDPFFTPDQGAVQVAQQAAQAGQKEVFDTAMISGLLKAVRQDSIVDRYLGDLMKAVDKLGRILFLFYWHQEEFEDRYGKQDLPELEDSLRNALETLGDVTLFLKEKSVGSINEYGGSGVGSTEPSVAEAARN